jgi:hypothetical protein
MTDLATQAKPGTGAPPTARECVLKVLHRQTPPRVVFAPNYWQWFAHYRQHGLLPAELRDCPSQLALIRHLGLDVFSRNIYCNQTECWFGGLATEVWEGVEVEVRRHTEGRDIVIEKVYHTRRGRLRERLRYLFAESTLVQEEYLFKDFGAEMDAFRELLRGRRWRFHPELYSQRQGEVGEDGLVVAGELFSPLKLLHFAAGADQAVFLLQDFPEQCRELLAMHEAAQLDLVNQMLQAGVPAMMSMDNLDSMFHPPHYIERWSASYYEQAARRCRDRGSAFFIHACGRQKAVLPLIASLGVDGLEGVAYPPLGDTPLEEAMRLAGDRLIISGGISAMETERFTTADEVRRYVETLLTCLRPYRHRFMLSASCNTSIRTSWRAIEWFRDAWREFGC